MSDVFTPLDSHDPRIALGLQGDGASPLLAAFNAAGVVTAGDVHVATTLGELFAATHPSADEVLLAVALTCRAVRTGSVCVDLGTVAGEFAALTSSDDAHEQALAELAWPETQHWLALLAASPLVAEGVLRLEGSLLYLDRYHEQESQVLDDLLARDVTAPAHDLALLESTLARVFPVGTDGVDTWVEQRDACRRAAARWTTVITGGPGTGKTTTVAGLLVALHEQYENRSLAETGRAASARIALAAPTGKAAARLKEAVGDAAARLAPTDQARLADLTTGTLHRLLRTDPGNSTRFRQNRHNHLPYDVVVVDEASMMSLTMTARLLEAMRPDARLVLVGDPDQLSSVDAGAVLGDLVHGYAGAGDRSPVAALVTTHRYTAGIAELAVALRQGDADAVLEVLGRGLSDVAWIDTDDDTQAADLLRPTLLAGALAVREHALAGEKEQALDAMNRHRLLCAHRDGSYGVKRWNLHVEQWLTAAGHPTFEQFYVGRPVLVSANDYGLGIHNGDSGVVVETPGGRRVVVDTPGAPRDFSPSRMDSVDTVHAMTIHKSQGSQAAHVTVLLPSEESRLLTRELFYTAVTRAQHTVTVVGSEAMVRAAVGRTARRASGLAERLSSRLGALTA
ncbi:exodeoxyribonuclease V subunit alpha [Nocardioides yefusunii]|uniref:RecBCD enzyme subunit RecD n=1 Tax=Nocardioides yefusunii TaxID=2500546 RepID=A0ABW1QZP6_9ACTN|nr:exodeoxyribonuclease V subunit alpha [Nocardioides yefusunii]